MESVVSQIRSLQPGQVFSRSRLIRANEMDTRTVAKARQQIMSYLSPVIARAKERGDDREYRIHTAVAMTKEYDVIVTGIITVEDDEI